MRRKGCNRHAINESHLVARARLHSEYFFFLPCTFYFLIRGECGVAEFLALLLFIVCIYMYKMVYVSTRVIVEVMEMVVVNNTILILLSLLSLV